MEFILNNIAMIVMAILAVVTYLAMNYAKIPLKLLTKLLPICSNAKLKTAINAGAGLSESCVISSLLLSIINLITGLGINAEVGVLAGCLANFAYLFVENISKAKNGTLTEEDEQAAAEALDQLATQAEQSQIVLK